MSLASGSAGEAQTPRAQGPEPADYHAGYGTRGALGIDRIQRQACY